MDIFSGFMINDEVKGILFSMLMGLIAGCGIASGYMLANKGKKYSKNLYKSLLFFSCIFLLFLRILGFGCYLFFRCICDVFVLFLQLPVSLNLVLDQPVKPFAFKGIDHVI